MMAVGNSLGAYPVGDSTYQSALSEAENPIPDMARIQQELARLAAELAEVRDVLGKIGTEMFGSPPPTAIDPVADGKGAGQVDRIHSQIAELHRLAVDLHRAAQRFARLV